MNADFLIPVTIDSNDRLRNLFRSVVYLSSQFKDSKIYIINQTSELSDETIYKYIKSYSLNNVILHNISIDLPCHKTKLINIGIDMCIFRDNIVMYDCDVLIPEEQIELSVELCDRGYALVYPYSNPQYNVNQFHFDEFQDNYDFVELQKVIDPYQIRHLHKQYGYPIIAYAPGFCLTLNKKELGKHIYYNEEFRSPQFEDAEYISKMDFLKMKMTRVYGPVFHFQHERITEIKFPETIQNNKKIHDKIMSMTYEEKKEYYKAEDK